MIEEYKAFGNDYNGTPKVITIYATSDRDALDKAREVMLCNYVMVQRKKEQ